MSLRCNIVALSLKRCGQFDVFQPLHQCKITLTFTRAELPLSSSFLLVPSRLVSSLLRSRISMCVAQSISSEQLAQVDPAGMVSSHQQQHTRAHAWTNWHTVSQRYTLSSSSLKQKTHTRHTQALMFVMSGCAVLCKSGPMPSVWYTSTVCVNLKWFTAPFCRWRTHEHQVTVWELGRLFSNKQETYACKTSGQSVNCQHQTPVLFHTAGNWLKL